MVLVSWLVLTVLRDVLRAEHRNAQTGKRRRPPRPVSGDPSRPVLFFFFSPALYSSACFLLAGRNSEEAERHLCSSAPLPVTRGSRHFNFLSYVSTYMSVCVSHELVLEVCSVLLTNQQFLVL